MTPSVSRRLARRTAAGLGIAAVSLTTFLGAGVPALAAGTGDQVTLLNINDFHGRISSTAKDLACTVVTEEKAAPNSALLSAGDNIGASEFASYIDDDNPTIDYLNALGLGASAAGNHEYDKGYDDFTNRVQERADWPYLAANVTKDGAPTTDPYAIVDAGDVKVAVVGAVTQETPGLTSPAGLQGVEFGDPVDGVNAAIEELEASGEQYDVLAVEYHEGSSGSSDAGSAPTPTPVFTHLVDDTSAAADVIFTAHTHQSYVYQAAVPGESGETRPVVQTGSYGENLGKVTLEKASDGDWDVVADATALVPTEGADLDACAGDAAYDSAATIADDAAAAGEEAAKKEVGDIDTDVTTAYAPDGAEYVDGVWTKKTGYTGRGDDRGSSSALSDELADSMVWATQQDSYSGDRATIGVMNPGGVRDNLAYAPSGDEGNGVVTYGEANNIVPFVNNLSTTTLTGAQFKDLLEEQWQLDADGNVPSRGYLQLGLSGNVDYTFDESAAQGEHITSVSIDGKPLDPEASYSLVAASFLVAGGDNFHTFAKGTNTKDTGLLDRDAWISYLGKHRGLKADYSQRGIGVQITAGTGSSIVRLTGLESRSLGAPQISTATLEIDGETFSAPYKQNKDGQWGADVRVTLPAGEHEGTVTAVPVTGTSITFPITLETEPVSFSDVPAGMQFSEDITWAAAQGYVTGWSDGTYRPLQDVNRDAMAAFLYRMAGEPAVTLPKTSPFTDVKPTDQHYTAIVWAQQQGITTGWNDGTFRPTTPIARDAMAAFLYRYAGEPRYSDPVKGPFEDVSASRKYAKEIAWLQSTGISTGWSDGTYRPLSPMKRDAMAAFMHRMDDAGIEYVED